MRWHDCAERSLKSKLFVKIFSEIKESGFLGARKKIIAVAMHVYTTRANKFSTVYTTGFWDARHAPVYRPTEGDTRYSLEALATIKQDTLFKYAPYVDRYQALIRKGERPRV
jgi:hypothetical protein